MVMRLGPGRLHRFSLPEDAGARTATWSLLMAAGTVVALVVAAAVGTLLQVVVFHLQEQESIGHAGAWGYLAGVLLVALTIVPALAGVILARRAQRLGDRSRGSLALGINVSIAALLIIPAIANILFG